MLTARGHQLTVGGEVVVPELLATAVHAKGNVPPFSTLAQAKQAVMRTGLPTDFKDVEIEHLLVDAAVLYPGVQSSDEIEIHSVLDPSPVSDAPVKNVLLSHREGGTVTYSRIGLLDTLVIVNPSLWRAVTQFTEAGALHIVQGADHLLFLACLAWANIALRALVLRVTAFSIGHSLSLVAAYFGIVPETEWFTAAVELAIAMSVFAAAFVLLVNRSQSQYVLPVAFGFGIVHGMGFSFGIRELVATVGTHVVTSFLSFSLGGEVVQIVVGGGLWILFRKIKHLSGSRLNTVHTVVVLGILSIAFVWVWDRSVLVHKAMADL